MKKRCFSMLAKLMAVVLIFTAVPVYNAEVSADEIVYGDIDADTAVNAQDALLALKFAAKMVEFSETAFVKGDVDGTDTVDAKDALLILKYAAKMIDKFPVEEETVDPTEVPSDIPSGIPTVCPTEVVTEAPKYDSFPIGVVYEGEIATVEGDTITFKHPSISQDGVMLENPFAGKDTSNGLAISFWMRTTETVDGDNYTFRALITALRDNCMQAVKFDLEGTRQLATVDGDKLNYWEARDAYINVDEEYFITLVVNPDGLDYYVDGYSVGYSGYSGIGESTAAATAMALFAMDTTVLYAGGTSAADFGLQNENRIYDHKLPEGTIISGLTGYLGNFTESDVEDLYLSVKEGHEPIPTTAPTTPPTATPEPTEEITPAPTEDLTPTPPAEITPEPSESEAPVESEEPVPTESEEPVPTEELEAFSGVVYIASDSIADGYDNRMPEGGTDVVGWGNIFANYFTSDVTVKNEANLGDSTKSYYYDYDNDGDGDGHRYKAVYNNIAKNDYVIICFGHNDGPANRRDVPVGKDSSEKGCYQWYLKNYYIEPALAVGATPILMTPVVRNFYKNGVFTEEDYHLEYGQAVRDLVAEYEAAGITIPLIDAQKYTYELYQTLSQTEAAKYHATNDTTHYNQAGCERLCEFITSELKTYNLGIKQYIVK